METSDGFLLGGRVRYAQPVDGYRTGIEPVLLAASVPARPGERVLEAGAGAGAGLLCLAARVPGLSLTGVEIDPAMAALARRNLAANGMAGEVWTGDITMCSESGFDHAFANPPWHDQASTPSPVARRRLAKQGNVLESWVRALVRSVRAGGTVSLILPAAQVARACEAFAVVGFGVGTTELLPKAGRAAKIAVVRGAVGDGVVVARPVVLHEEGGKFTAGLEAVLRGGAALEW